MARMSSSERRSELVHAALRVIASKGIAAATTRAIVAEAGMPLASFHYAFRSRDEMMRELIAYVVANETTAALSTVGDAPDVRSAVRGGLQGYFDLLRAEPGREQVMFELMHYALRTPELDDLPPQQYASYHAAVLQVLEAGALGAGIEWMVPPADLARIVVTITDGVTLAWLADRDDAAAGRVLDFAADALAALARPSPAQPEFAQPHPVSPTTEEHTA